MKFRSTTSINMKYPATRDNADLKLLLNNSQKAYTYKNRSHMLKLIYMDIPHITRHKSAGRHNVAKKLKGSAINSSVGLASVDRGKKIGNYSLLETQNAYEGSNERLKTRTKYAQFKTAQNVRKNFEKSKCDLVFQRGKEKLKAKDYKNAIMCFEEAYKLNEKNIDSLIYKAIALMDTGDINNAITVLESIISLKAPKVAYLLLAIGYKKTNRTEAAIETLNEVLTIENQYMEALMFRAKIYSTTNRWTEARNDFSSCVRINNKNLQACIGLAECEERLNNIEAASNAYDNVLMTTIDLPVEIYTKKVRMDIKLRRHERALEVIEMALKKYKGDIKICMLKAKVLDKLNRTEDAALQYEQLGNREVKALFRLAKMRLRCKDYYEAYFDMKRFCAHGNVEKKVNVYKILIDGVVALIKKKNKSGMKCLRELEYSITLLKSDIVFIYHTFKAYVHMIQRDFNVFFLYKTNRKH